MNVVLANLDVQETVDKIYTACRTCYNAGKPEDMYKELKDREAEIGRDELITPLDNEKKLKLIKHVLNSGHHCYDDQTEVLTSKGFKPWTEITDADKLAAIDAEGNLIGYETPQDLIVQDYEGPMYHFKNNKVDLMVTPEHRLYCSLSGKDNRTNPEFQVIRANELVGGGKYRKEVAFKPIRFKCFTNTKLEGVYNPLGLSEDKIIAFNKFVGFFIGDGDAIAPSQSPSFHIKKKRKVEYLKKICEELDFELVENKNKNNNYTVFYNNLGKYCNENLYDEDRNKRVPDEYLHCSYEVISAVLDGLINSDGYVSAEGRKNSVSYHTTSVQVAERVQELFFLTGGRTTFEVKDPSAPCFEVRRCYNDSNNLPHINNARHKESETIIEQYKGKIYCATVSTGLLAVRRGEKKAPVISGNSTIEHITATFFISGVSRALTHQLIRHRIGCNFSQQSQRYVEFKDGVFDYVIPPTIQKNPEALNTFKMAMEHDSTYYNALVKLGIPAEDARAVLPNACCTNLTFTVNLRELIHICNERLCTCAQAEIRQMVKLMADRVSQKLPFMKEYLVPKCGYLGYCNEPASRTCGRKPLKTKFFNED